MSTYIGCYCSDESVDRSLRGRTAAIARQIADIERVIQHTEEGDAYFRSMMRGLIKTLESEAAVDKL